MTALGRVVLVAALAVAAGPSAGADLALDAGRLASAPVRYRDAAALPAHPVPVVVARRAGLAAGAGELADIREKILYPFLNRSPKAVAAIVLEWLPAQPEALGVVVVWADGDVRESIVARGAGGRYAANAWEPLVAKPTP